MDLPISTGGAEFFFPFPTRIRRWLHTERGSDEPPGLEDRLEKESKVYALYGWGIRQSMVRMIGPREVR